MARFGMALPFLASGVGDAARTGNITVLQNRSQGGDERVPARAQFVQPFMNDQFQRTLASGEQDDTDLPLVVSAAGAADVTVRLQAIDQAYGAVMPKKQALREPTDGGIVFVGELANRKKHLVLLGLEAGGFGGVITSAEELADTIAQFGQCGVFGVANLSSHS